MPSPAREFLVRQLHPESEQAVVKELKVGKGSAIRSDGAKLVHG